jgi:hypothetical protein
MRSASRGIWWPSTSTLPEVGTSGAHHADRRHLPEPLGRTIDAGARNRQVDVIDRDTANLRARPDAMMAGEVGQVDPTWGPRGRWRDLDRDTDRQPGGVRIVDIDFGEKLSRLRSFCVSE